MTVKLSTTDEGKGVDKIVYSVKNSGQVVKSDTVQGDSANFIVDTEGENTVTYHATDEASNVEEEKTLTIKIDKSAPTVVGTTPADLTSKVSRNVSPTATFSDEMNAETLNSDIVKLYTWNAKKRAWKAVSATVRASGKTVIIDPINPLAAKKRHMLTVTRGAENVAELQLDHPTSWVFVTGKR